MCSSALTQAVQPAEASASSVLDAVDAAIGRTDKSADNIEDVDQRQGRHQLRQLHADAWPRHGIAHWTNETHLQEGDEQREVEALAGEQGLQQHTALNVHVSMNAGVRSTPRRFVIYCTAAYGSGTAGQLACQGCGEVGIVTIELGTLFTNCTIIEASM